MRKFVKECWARLSAMNCLFRSKLPLSMQLGILFHYWRINFKNWAFGRSLRREHFFGFEIRAFDYAAIRYLYEEIFCRGEYNFITESETPFVLDCGANIGMATIYFKWRFPKSTIIAYEPDPEIFKLLKKNVERNRLQGVQLRNVALSGVAGSVDFYVHSKIAGSLINSTHAGRIAEEARSCVRVDAVTLSSEVKDRNVDFLKMDIEGGERDVFRELDGSDGLRRIKEGVVEYHHKIPGSKSQMSEFLALLERNGFEYQIDASFVPLSSKGFFQDVMIHFYRAT